jgi:hypothetical protein
VSQEAELDRFYSKFPAGSVGLALLVLRLVDGLGLFGEGIHVIIPGAIPSGPLSVLLLSLALGASATLLIVGLRTSLAGVVAAVCAAGAAWFGMHHHLDPTGSEMAAHMFLLVLLFFVSNSLALLGPGGYSLDARLSGWRMINLSSRSSSGKGTD